MSGLKRSNQNGDEDGGQKLGALFDLVSGEYENNRFFKVSAAEFSLHIEPDGEAKLLDVATGTGLVALQLAEKYKQLHVTGIDLSLGMLQEARKKAKAGKLSSRTEFRQMDAMDMAFASNHFDFVTCSYGIFFLPDMVAGLDEFLRVLKPGGKLVFSSFARGHSLPIKISLWAEPKSLVWNFPGKA